jgi:hypothetical protein
MLIEVDYDRSREFQMTFFRWLRSFFAAIFPKIKAKVQEMLRNSVGPLVVTLISFGLVGWALYHVFGNLGTAPITDGKGTIISSPLQNAKDVLTAVIPFASAAVGFWFGSDGKTQAQNQALQAQNQAKEAQGQASAERDRAVQADRQKAAVLSAADNAKDLLDKARQIAPEAFS